MTRPSAGWRAAWRIARRGLDWRFRGLRLLVVCLVLGAAALATIGTLTGAIERELATRGRVMLGGDIEVSVSQREAAADELAAMRGAGRVSAGMRMQAMAVRDAPSSAASVGGEPLAVPVELKAVDAAWPLVGAYRLASGPAAAPRGMTAHIAPGVADRLGVGVGDRLRIGRATLAIGGIIADEPDRLGEGFQLGPTVIVGMEALAASGLVQPGSMAQAKYRIALDGSESPQAVADALKARFPTAGWEVRTRDRATPGLARFVGRMGQFLVLVALAALAIAGIGIAGGVSSWLETRRGSIATLKVLGASGGDIVRIHLIQLAVAAGLATATGLAIGVALTPLVSAALGELLPVTPGWVVDGGALLRAAAYAALIALIFAAPPLLAAREFPAMALLRARVAPLGRGRLAALGVVTAGLAGLVVLVLATSPQPALAAGFLAGSAAVFALLAAIGRGIAKLAARVPRPRHPIARMALANLHRPGAQTGALVVALGFALAAFVLIAAVQTSLDANIVRSVPNRAPDYFVLDVPRDRYAAFEQTVQAVAPGADLRAVPALRGTITGYGPADAMTRVADLERISDEAWPLRGERGLTYAEELPAGNVLTAGEWWPKGYAGEPLVSVDAELGKALGLGVGDRLTVSLLGVERTARIASLRRIDWESLGFNYVLVFSPNAIADAPHNLAATIELPASAGEGARRALLGRLVSGFPSTSVIEIGPVLAQARTILSQMGAAILAAASVAVLAGLAVLAGAVAAARERRAYDTVVLRVLGASRRQLLGVLLAEYAMLGAVLAVAGLALGLGAGWLVIERLFEFDWLPDWLRVLAVLASGVALAVGLAVAGSLGVLRTRPARALREL